MFKKHTRTQRKKKRKIQFYFKLFSFYAKSKAILFFNKIELIFFKISLYFWISKHLSLKECFIFWLDIFQFKKIHCLSREYLVQQCTLFYIVMWNRYGSTHAQPSALQKSTSGLTAKWLIRSVSMVFRSPKGPMCLAIHTTYISQFAATFNDARNREIHCSTSKICLINKQKAKIFNNFHKKYFVFIV